MPKVKQRVLDPIPFTKEGYQKVKDEYDELFAKRQELVDRVAVARSYGDLSENAAYHEARKNLFDADRRLRHLKMQLIYGVVDDSAEAGSVTLGSHVTVKNDQGEQVFTIVGAFEADPALKKLSIKSPIGAALLDKRVGDMVHIQIPSGTITYEIIAIN